MTWLMQCLYWQHHWEYQIGQRWPKAVTSGHGLSHRGIIRISGNEKKYYAHHLDLLEWKQKINFGEMDKEGFEHGTPKPIHHPGTGRILVPGGIGVVELQVQDIIYPWTSPMHLKPPGPAHFLRALSSTFSCQHSRDGWVLITGLRPPVVAICLGKKSWHW